MASLLAQGAKQIGLALGKEVLSAAIDKGKHKVLGPSETEKIHQDVQKLATQVLEIKGSIDELSNKLTDGLLRLRSDHLNEHQVSIDSSYDAVLGALVVCYKDYSYLAEEERQLKVEKAQDRVEELLHRACNQIPQALDKINIFLRETGPQSFLTVAAQRALIQSADLIAYYGKMKTMVLNYWITVAKGLLLLRMAFDHPDVGFTEGMSTISKHEMQLEVQEEIFRSAVGYTCADIAEAILMNPHGRTTVRFRAKYGWNVCRHHSAGFAYTGHDVPYSDWYLEPRTPLEPLDLTMGKKYALKIINSTCNEAGYFGGSEYHTMFQDPESALSSWYIKPWQQGSNKYTIQFQSNWSGGTNNGFFMDVQRMDTTSEMCCIRKIDYINELNLGTFFEFEVLKK